MYTQSSLNGRRVHHDTNTVPHCWRGQIGLEFRSNSSGSSVRASNFAPNGTELRFLSLVSSWSPVAFTLQIKCTSRIRKYNSMLTALEIKLSTATANEKSHKGAASWIWQNIFTLAWFAADDSCSNKSSAIRARKHQSRNSWESTAYLVNEGTLLAYVIPGSFLCCASFNG